MRAILVLVLALFAAPALAGVSDAQLAQTEQLVLVRAQALRAHLSPHGAPLVLDPDLVRVARLRAAEIAVRYGHTDMAGDNPYQIIMHELPNFRGAVGENIMQDPIRASFDPMGTADRVIAAWTASPPHAANIASSNFDKIGIGAAEKDGTVYVVLVFTGPLPAHLPGNGAP